jgi:hypothetical protein
VGTTGEAPIGYPDIDAWQRLTGERVSAWEVELIIQLDALGRRLTWEAYRRRK